MRADQCRHADHLAGRPNRPVPIPPVGAHQGRAIQEISAPAGTVLVGRRAKKGVTHHLILLLGYDMFGPNRPGRVGRVIFSGKYRQMIRDDEDLARDVDDRWAG